MVVHVHFDSRGCFCPERDHTWDMTVPPPCLTVCLLVFRQLHGNGGGIAPLATPTTLSALDEVSSAFPVPREVCPMPPARTPCPDCHNLQVTTLTDILYHADMDFFRCEKCQSMWHVPKGKDGPPSKSFFEKHTSNTS